MCYFKTSKFKANQAENDLAFTFDETSWMGGNPMICIQNKRGTGRAILLTLFLAFLLPAGAAPAQAAGGTSVSMDGKDVNSSTVVVLPKDAAVAFSLKLNGTYGKGYTSGNGTVAQTGTVQRFADGQAVYAVKAVGQPGESAGLYIDGEKILEMKIAAGAVCPACGETDCAFVQVEDGSWRTDGEQRDCVHYAYGKDTREAMDVYNIYTCSKCGASPKMQTGIAHRWICHGSRG